MSFRTIWNQPRLYPLYLVIIAISIFVINLGKSQLWDRDEPRNAGCAAEMMARGDWVVPIFNDQLRHQKPVLLYWVIMAAYSVFGQSEFAARIGSAMLATGTVLASFGIAEILAGRRVAFLTGVVLATSLMFDVAARAATPDSVLIFCGTTAIWFYCLGIRQHLHFQREFGDSQNVSPSQQVSWFPEDWRCTFGIYVMLGLAVLAKGPVGFLLPMATLGLFMLIRRQPQAASDTGDHDGKRDGNLSAFIKHVARLFGPVHFVRTLWQMRPLLGAAVVLLVAVPWYVAVHVRTQGDFTQLFFWTEHVGRATSSFEDHRGGLWFYPLAILIGFFPWSVFWGPVVLTLWRTKRETGTLPHSDLLALCWIAVQVGAFSLAQTKLASYITPCYPALAMLTSRCLVDWADRKSSISLFWYKLALFGLAIGGVLVAIGLGIATNLYFPRLTSLVLLGLIPVGGAVAAYCLLRVERRIQVLQTLCLSGILFAIGVFGVGTVVIHPSQAVNKVLENIRAAPADQLVAAYRCLESSWIYYGEKPIYECGLSGSNSGVPSLRRERDWQAKPCLRASELAGLEPSVIFLTTEDHVEELLQQLPDGFVITQSENYFLRRKNILAVQRQEFSNVRVSARDISGGMHGSMHGQALRY